MEVVIPDRWRGTQRPHTHDLTPEMRERIAWLNDQLCAAEAWLDGWAKWLKHLSAMNDPRQPEGPWQLDVRISLVLDAADPEHDEDSDNIICQMFDTLALQPGDDSPCYPVRDWRKDFFTSHPLREMPHCWLARVLMDEDLPTLGWGNTLRIGGVWVEAFLTFNKDFPLHATETTPAASHPIPARTRTWEGSNWKKTLTAKRLPEDKPCETLTPADIARIEEMNTCLTRVGSHLITCGQWFHAAYTHDATNTPDLDDVWDAETHLDFLLDKTDAMFQPDENNTLHTTHHSFASGNLRHYNGMEIIEDTTENWNERQHWSDYPLRHQHHCWLFHDLYDHYHPRLGWQKILRIGTVRAHTQIRFDQSFPPLTRE